MKTLATLLMLFAGSCFGQYSTPVRDVDNPARQYARAGGTLSPTPLNGDSVQIFTVPAGKRLVIEHVSARCYNGALPTYLQVYVFGSPGSYHFVPVNSNGISSQPLRLYADSGNNVQINVPISPSGGDCSFSVTGYYVTLP